MIKIYLGEEIDADEYLRLMRRLYDVAGDLGVMVHRIEYVQDDRDEASGGCIFQR